MVEIQLIKVRPYGNSNDKEVYLNISAVVTVVLRNETTYLLNTQGGNDTTHSYMVEKDSPEGALITQLVEQANVY